MKKTDIKGRNTVALTKKRMAVISIGFLLFLSLLISNLFKLQITGYDYYTNKVYDQITTTSPLRATRGSIYDTNMNLLATTNTEWRIFISTRDIKKAEKGYYVTFKVFHKEEALMELTVYAADFEQAEQLKRNFLKDPSHVYATVAASLFV